MIDSLCLVRRRIALIEGRGPGAGARADTVVRTGHAAVDQALGGGTMRGRLHELLAETGEAGSGAGFVAVLAHMLGGDWLWLSEDRAGRQAGALNPAGLCAIGLDPARLIVAILPDAVTVLRAAANALRCAALGGVVIELSGDPRPLDLTATRRLALAAEESGVTPLLLRLGGTATPSAAQTRWRVKAAPSWPLAANAPGHPAWDVELLRQRGRPDGGIWRVEWDREQGRLRDWHQRDDEALPGIVVPLSPDRPAGAGAPLRQVG